MKVLFIMTELTQNLLELDSTIKEELNMANKLAQEIVIASDVHAKSLMDEARELFDKEKENELEILSNKLEKKRLLAVEELKKNINKFDKDFDITKLVDRLILVAKEKVCP